MHHVVTCFLDSVEARDIDAVLACLSEDVRYQNVPHRPVFGHDGVRGMLGPFLAQCSAVRWDVVATAENGDLTFAERVDRFRIGGDEYTIECNGVFRVQDDRIVEVRDYVDLGVWHERLGPARAILQ